jgi:hypothetical protein
MPTILLGLTSALCYALVDLLMMSVVRRMPVAIVTLLALAES